MFQTELRLRKLSNAEHEARRLAHAPAHYGDCVAMGTSDTQRLEVDIGALDAAVLEMYVPRCDLGAGVVVGGEWVPVPVVQS